MPVNVTSSGELSFVAFADNLLSEVNIVVSRVMQRVAHHRKLALMQFHFRMSRIRV